jgi:predicted CXXCH cytochrome family protein
MPNQHAPFAGKKCETCHKQGGESAFALVSDVKSLCTRCHSSVRDDANTSYNHNLGDERSCLNCHNPHASSQDVLLAGTQQSMCTGCHFKGEEYEGKTRESLLTHKGMDCTNCHRPHGSPNEHYFVRPVVELCADCHERAHRSTHPIGPEVIDPRTGVQVTCASCHQLHGADFDPYLPLSPEMDLCIQCHTR